MAAFNTTLSISPSTLDINGTNTFTITVAYSIAVNRLRDVRADVAGQTFNIGTVTSSSFTWTPPATLLNSMPGITSATVTISGQPASNNVDWGGRESRSCTVTVPASYVPTAPTGVTLTRVDNGVPSDWGLYVQNKSKLNVSWSAATGTGGATIREYRVYTDSGSSYYKTTGTSYTNLGPFSAGIKTVRVIAVDSRGRTATSTNTTFEVQPYGNPGVASFKIDRTTVSGAVDNLDAYMKASVVYTFASVSGKNSASATFAFKATNSSTYSSETPIPLSTPTLANPVIFGGSFVSTQAYHVRFTVTDALGTATTYIATVESLRIALEFESGGGMMHVRCPTSGISYTDLTNRPSLAAVATSGNYNDLTNKPTTTSVTAASITNWSGLGNAAIPLSKVGTDNMSMNLVYTSANGGGIILQFLDGNSIWRQLEMCANSLRYHNGTAWRTL